MSTPPPAAYPAIDLDQLSIAFAERVEQVRLWVTSYAFLEQAVIVGVAIILAFILSRPVLRWLDVRRTKYDTPEASAEEIVNKRQFRPLVFPLILTLTLVIAGEISKIRGHELGLPQICLGLSAIYLIRAFVNRFVRDPFIVFVMNYMVVPASLLLVVGFLDDFTSYLDTLKVSIGSITLSVYALVRTVFFGAILFWLGRLSDSTGKRVIRSRQDLDLRTREIATKFFEIALFVVIAILLLQVMGINLTALAVFGGAVGVGLGFGLQQIASNFISGIIILLDKSITIGDFIELEDGRAGRLRELSMRSATLETYDGKDIMVPNETFITTSFTNWTHNNVKQRYSLNFTVAFKTDLPALFDIVREVVASHPQVLSGPDVPIEERPDAEIESFGEYGVIILVEFWMNGVDDGPNRVGADLLLMIWTALKQHNIEIPFPQREVAILGSEQINPLRRDEA